MSVHHTDPSPGADRAWGWVAHLRGGGTTPWHAWAGGAEPTARVLPGAQQLELLRRINIAESSDEPHRGRSHLSTRLADRVVTAAAPGRGKPDLPLVGVGPSAYGPLPVDPSLLPADELIRVATSVLAEDVVALGVPAPARQLPRSWRRDVRVVGNPLEAAHLRAYVVGRRPPSRKRAAVLVVGGPLDQMLADVWSRRCFERGSGAWLEWLRFWQQRGELPPRIDLPAVAARQLESHRGVRVVLDSSALPELLRVRRIRPPTRPGADAAELARRIATVVGLLVPSEVRAALMTETLLPRMPATDTPPVALPDEHRAWVGAAAHRMARQLRCAGYPVVGDPDSVLPLESSGSGASVAQGAASSELVLELAVRMLVDQTWKATKTEGSR
ncbi:MAG: hypothetical protein JWN68_3762 [Nocardioides sp.]|uniref:hypothetical protein n=1 Tax=Nocardioides sp. TaxID=35761 RepID=UPI00261C4778|nr:hypothetical protein [Nocardioides sp.]MCW2835809.1 hypothetical protein [Nocardioides sp.]